MQEINIKEQALWLAETSFVEWWRTFMQIRVFQIL